jgi:caffeoyl-CoA O-methyltransferase
MTAALISTQLEDYVEQFVPDRPLEMVKMEEDARKTGFPIIGPSCGYLSYQAARMIRARHICELGSGFGYSTAWFAKAVKENGGGTVHHIVWDEDLSKRAKVHLTALGYDDIVAYHVGEAIVTLRGMN